MKLNLGCGEQPLEGYENLDRKRGNEVYPLAYELILDDVEEIRASHVLEHFSHREVAAVMKDWVKALKPGGVLKIAVPNFEWIAKHYLDGKDINVQGYTMGGQVDEDDFHKCVFDEDELRNAMLDAGLVDIKPWKSEIHDCAALPVSLNLMGTKPDKSQPAATERPAMKVSAVMSVPRLGFMDNFFCAFEALLPLGISLRKYTGAFWGQCLSRCMDQAIEEGADWILTIDYDSIFTKQDVEALLSIAGGNAASTSDVDAIAPLQASRTKPSPLMTMNGPDGKKLAEVPADTFDTELTKVATAHFGLTLIRVEALKKLPKPWFLSVPDERGEWGEGRTDDDIYFWRKFEEYGFGLYQANRVPIGHAELMVRWPGRDFQAIYQHPSNFYSEGKPSEVWK